MDAPSFCPQLRLLRVVEGVRDVVVGSDGGEKEVRSALGAASLTAAGDAAALTTAAEAIAHLHG